jgi:hypothetical protein
MSKNQKNARGSRSLAVDVMLGAAVLISAISYQKSRYKISLDCTHFKRQHFSD